MKALAYILLMVTITAGCQFSSNCLNKESFLSGFNEFVDDVRINHEKIAYGNWRDIDQEYDEYLRTCYPKYKEELSIKEKIDFWKNAFSYNVYRKSVDETFEIDFEEYGLNLEEEIEALSQEGQRELEKFLKEELSPQIEDAFDSLINEIESVGDQLKNWLDNL